MGIETPKMPIPPTPEEMAKMQKERALSDAELIKEGAEYKIDAEGNLRLEVEGEQIESAREEMNAKLLTQEWIKEHENLDAKIEQLPTDEHNLFALIKNLKTARVLAIKPEQGGDTPEEWEKKRERIFNHLGNVMDSLLRFSDNIDSPKYGSRHKRGGGKTMEMWDLAEKKWEEETLSQMKKGDFPKNCLGSNRVNKFETLIKEGL